MKRQSLFQIIALVSFCTACTNEISEDVQDTLSVQATLNTASTAAGTRTALSVFSGQTIGVFVEGTGYSPTTYSTCTVNSSGSTSSLSPDIYLNAEASVYGFYPVTDVTLASPTSSSKIPVTILSGDDLSGTSQTDYLYAVADYATESGDKVSKTYPTVDLVFHHALAELTFNLNRSSTYAGTCKLTKIELSTSGSTSYFQTGTTNMAVSDGTFDAFSSSTTTALTFSSTTGVTLSSSDVSTAVATVLVAPQTFPADTQVTLTVDGETYTTALPTGVTSWAAGSNYIYKFKITGETLTVDNNVIISDWTPISGGDETEVN
jgi:hypothetical protein